MRDDVRRLAREFPRESLVVGGRPVTNLLVERLTAADIAEIQRRVSEDATLVATVADPNSLPEWAPLLLAYGIWLDVPSVGAKTGLRAAQPPEAVHAMARGPEAAAGGIYEADLVVSALSNAGIALSTVGSGLDFGCSSGRVVRVLAAAYPDVRWMGCDPNEQAIVWAGEHLPDIEFFLSPKHPPLPLQPASLDLVLAISIWSHFEPRLGLRWFADMHRLIRPGGCLVFTTHGLQSVAVHAQTGLRPSAQALEIERALYARGRWYAAEFGPEGDWGVADPGWGTAFLSPEWILSSLCPSWHVLEFVPGGNQSNQDVYVLQRS